MAVKDLEQLEIITDYCQAHRPPGYESDELCFGNFCNARNLRKTQNLAGLKRNRYVDHGDHDDHELATFWLQSAFKCKHKIRPWMVASGPGVALAGDVRCRCSVVFRKTDGARFCGVSLDPTSSIRTLMQQPCGNF